jgi:hypothetical protein
MPTSCTSHAGCIYPQGFGIKMYITRTREASTGQRAGLQTRMTKGKQAARPRKNYTTQPNGIEKRGWAAHSARMIRKTCTDARPQAAYSA